MANKNREIANIEILRKLYHSTKQVIDPRPIMVVVMKNCGASFREVGEVFGVTRQQAETIYKKAIKELK